MHPQPWDAFAGEQNGVPKGSFTLYHAWRRDTDSRVVECHRAA